MKHIKFYLTMILSTMLVLIGVIAEGAITSGVPITGNYFTGIKSTESENLITNPTPYKTDTGIDAGTGMTITRATTTAAFRFQNQAYWAVQSSTQGACRSFTKRTPYGPLLNGQCMAGLMFNGDATGYSIRIENSTGSILSETPLDFVSGYTRAYTPGVTCGDNSERVVKICRTASGAGATIGVGDVFYGSYKVSTTESKTAWADYTPVISGLGSGSAINLYGSWKQSGQNIDVIIRFRKDGTNGSGSATVTATLPTGKLIDLTKSPNNGFIQGTSGKGSGADSIFVPYQVSQTTIGFMQNDASVLTGAEVPANMFVETRFSVPIEGLSAGAQLADQFGGEPISSIARRITNQSVSSMSPTTVQLDVALKDTAGMINTTTYETTIKSSGDYDVGMGAVIVNGNIGERFTITAYVNGVATFLSTSVEGQGANSATTMTSFPAYPLVRNDKVTLVVTSNADTSYTVAFATLGLKKVTPQFYTIQMAPVFVSATGSNGAAVANNDNPHTYIPGTVISDDYGLLNASTGRITLKTDGVYGAYAKCGTSLVPTASNRAFIQIAVYDTDGTTSLYGFAGRELFTSGGNREIFPQSTMPPLRLKAGQSILAQYYPGTPGATSNFSTSNSACALSLWQVK